MTLDKNILLFTEKHRNFLIQTKRASNQLLTNGPKKQFMAQCEQF